MIAFWPGTIRPSSVSDLPAAGWDFMATLADLAGVQAPRNTDGISLVPTLIGKNDRQAQREYLYWEYHWGKQQAVRIGRHKGVRFGGTKEPIELYDLMTDVGERTNIASSRPELVKKIDSIMEAARKDSEFTRYWPLPEHRLYNVKWDKWIFDQLEKGIDWDKH
jgi:arylsulfatase A-like enzyme